MAEPRRLEFTAIDTNIKEKKPDAKRLHHRFMLTLSESNATTCPEFSYAELWKNVVGGTDQEGNDGPETVGDQAENEKIDALAKSFEAKYGPKPTKKKKRRQHIEDLVDLGEGYDETDPFVDNSEAYDEIVPSCLTTKLGGFYINSGVLDFREVSDGSDDEFKDGTPVKKRKKIRKIESDSDEENNGEVKKKRGRKKKLKDGSIDGMERKKKRLSIHAGSGEKPFKKPGRPVDKDKLKKKTSPTVAELLKQQTEPVTSSTNQNGLPEGYLSSGPFSPSAINGAGSDVEGGATQALMKDDSNSQDDEPREKVMPTNPDFVPKLPLGLPNDLEENIKKLKEAAKEPREGKNKFFTNSVNKMLLDVEISCRQLPHGQRTFIYSHLAAFLPCGKETLIKRAKKLHTNDQDDKLKEPIKKLKDAVDQVMPALIEKYTVELQAADLNKPKPDSSALGCEDASTESDEEEKATLDGEKKHITGPRKKFMWTDGMRLLLNNIVRVKLQCYEMMKMRAQTAEEYLRAFLDAEVKPLWPKGWMQTRMLFKESRMTHAAFTNPSKPKKNIIAIKSTATAMGIPVMPSVKVHSANASTMSNAVSSNAGLTYKDYSGIGNPGLKSPEDIIYISDTSPVVSTRLPKYDSGSSIGASSIPMDYASNFDNPAIVTSNSGQKLVSNQPKPSKKDVPCGTQAGDLLKKMTANIQGKSDSSALSLQGSLATTSNSGNSFLAQFQNFAQSVYHQQISIEQNMGTSSSQSAVAKQQPKEAAMVSSQQQHQFKQHLANKDPTQQEVKKMPLLLNELHKPGTDVHPPWTSKPSVSNGQQRSSVQAKNQQKVQDLVTKIAQTVSPVNMSMPPNKDELISKRQSSAYGYISNQGVVLSTKAMAKSMAAGDALGFISAAHQKGKELPVTSPEGAACQVSSSKSLLTGNIIHAAQAIGQKAQNYNKAKSALSVQISPPNSSGSSKTSSREQQWHNQMKSNQAAKSPTTIYAPEPRQPPAKSPIWNIASMVTSSINKQQQKANPSSSPVQSSFSQPFPASGQLSPGFLANYKNTNQGVVSAQQRISSAQIRDANISGSGMSLLSPGQRTLHSPIGPGCVSPSSHAGGVGTTSPQGSQSPMGASPQNRVQSVRHGLLPGTPPVSAHHPYRQPHTDPTRSPHGY